MSYWISLILFWIILAAGIVQAMCTKCWRKERVRTGNWQFLNKQNRLPALQNIHKLSFYPVFNNFEKNESALSRNTQVVAPKIQRASLRSPVNSERMIQPNLSSFYYFYDLSLISLHYFNIV